jgi:hypothetical protein
MGCTRVANLAAPVDAPIGILFHVGRPRRRGTEQRRSAGITLYAEA